MELNDLYQRYQNLQSYVHWSPADQQRVRAVGPDCEASFDGLIDDFYAEIDRHPHTRQVITGGAKQIERLKGSLRAWLRELFSGNYDRDYVARRWRVGGRHVEIGLDQVYTNMALSRLRTGLAQAIEQTWKGSLTGLSETLASFNKLLDLDLAIIEDAYQSEYHLRQQRSERLAAVGQMAGGVAHELRNPLNVIKTSVYFLLNAKTPTPEKTLEHLRRIERQVGLADGVITALSDFARLPFPDFRPLALEAILQPALEQSPLADNIQVIFDLPSALPPVLGDTGQLQIVFGNLIRNAGDAMPDGGRLTIAAARVDTEVEVAVTDTGIGIPREDLERILEPLYSTKPRGIGLGLSIVRAIIEKHHGKLKISSEPGKGSTFRVRLITSDSENRGHGHAAS